ncbi:MAG TPA: type II secretion system protein [Ramlibacter sp.]|nr:type II secretion system protein [Ramlibacter sp.]
MLLGLGLAGASEVWGIASQRARERELLWVGNQYARALKSYYMQSPGARQYPLRLDELVEDRRFPVPRRHLRQLYPDPVARSAEWDLILNAEGRIGGIASRSEQAPLKQAGFPLMWEKFEGMTKYSEWRFVADVNLLDLKKPPPPGTAATSSR